MMRSALVCLAIISTVPSAVAANAKHDIVAVAPIPSVQQWAATVSHRLDGALRYPYVFREPAPSGGVSVIFRCSDDGKPSTIQVVRSSGHARLDRAAVAGLQRIKTMHPLPLGIGHDQLFQANIVFATDEPTLVREAAALRSASRRSSTAVAANEPAPLVIAVHRLM